MITAIKPLAGPESAATQCCPLVDRAISTGEAQALATTFKALGDPTRLRLLSHVAERGCQDVCACDLTRELGVTQPTVSHHMKKLVEAGLVTREQRGKWAHYTVVPGAFESVRQFLDLS